MGRTSEVTDKNGNDKRNQIPGRYGRSDWMRMTASGIFFDTGKVEEYGCKKHAESG